MTRSVEIPEAAVVAAEEAYAALWRDRVDTPGVGMRAALAAALPYLAPAGDGGLREALEQLAKERDSVNGSTPSDYVIAPYEITELLAAHPAAPAVPQPATDGATKLDCGVCCRDDSDPGKVIFTYLAECGNHGRY